ncbi:hypothetical protein EII12_09625 [Buchananella hordeovulneris]|uniref:DUF6612 family protein n=1 Tax=Buchananella hordeovulneris TaxID=52770 RepID=UPI000F603681|nr:DUF6612 family protein [Buchananella hordeovulneris]RRD50268.1 hypothetical protein EII12_09625 [Buchananella hordeovulneris]
MQVRKIGAIGSALLLIGGMLTACKPEGDGKPVSGEQQRQIIDEIAAKFVQQDESDPTYLGAKDRTVTGDFDIAEESAGYSAAFAGKMTLRVDVDAKLSLLTMDVRTRETQPDGVAEGFDSKFDMYLNLEKDSARIYAGQDGQWHQQQLDLENFRDMVGSPQLQVDISSYLKNGEKVSLEEKGDTYVLRVDPRSEAIREQFSEISGRGQISDIAGEVEIVVDKDDYEMRSYRVDTQARFEMQGEEGKMRFFLDMDSRDESVKLQVPREALDAPEAEIFPH